MPDEVSAVREASGNPNSVKQALAQIDAGFAEELASDEIAQVSRRLK
jgi:hypothetical protein